MAMYFNVYIYVYYTMIFMSCHEDMVMLRSTTGPYGQPVLEVVYGEISYFTPPKLYGSG